MRNFLMFVAAIVMSGSFAGAARADAASDCRNWVLRSEKVALAACNQVIQKNPRAKWAYMERGRIYDQRGNTDGYDRAIADYTKVIEIDFNDVGAYEARALAYEFKRDYDRAIQDRTRLVEIAPDKVKACVDLRFDYSVRPGGRSIWEEDPRTAEICGIERPKPVQSAAIEKTAGAEPKAAREIDWADQLLFYGGRLVQLTLIGAAFGLSIGFLRTKKLRGALPAAVACGSATMFAVTALEFESLTGSELGAFWRFREDTIIEPLNSLLGVLGFQNSYEPMFWSGPLAGLRPSEVVALVLMTALLLSAIWFACSLDFSRSIEPSGFSADVKSGVEPSGFNPDVPPSVVPLDINPDAPQNVGPSGFNAGVPQSVAPFGFNSDVKPSVGPSGLSTDVPHRAEPSVFSPGDPHRSLAMAVPITILLGLAIAIAGFVLGPRDFMGRLDPAAFAIAAIGALLAVSVPFMIWRRTAPTLHFLLGTLAPAAIGIAVLRTQPVLSFGVLLVSFGLFLAAYLCFREWRRTNRVERAGLRRFAVAAFSWPFTPQNLMAERAARLDNEALVAAFHLPDHTSRAKAIVSAELSTRGLSQQTDPDWLPMPNRATLPPAVRMNIEPERYGRYMRNRKRLQQVVRWTSIVGIVSVVGLLVLIPIAQFINLIAGILGRKRTARVLLLRPFGRAQMTSALKRVVRRHLGLLGHTYTLSDQNYRPNFILEILNRVFGWIMYVLGPLLRPSLRVTSVKDERTFLMLSDFLLRKVSPSCLGLLCSDQAFNIRTTDAWWKRCIDLLMRSSDLIVMDISRVSTGSAWEVVELAKRGLLAKCVFIAQAGQSEDGLASIRQLLPPDAQPRVHMFDSEGKFAESTELDRLLQDRIFTAVARWGDRRQEPAIAAEPVAIASPIRA